LRLIELRFYIPLNTKYVISDTFRKPTFWFGVEKLNLAQQKHAFTNQNKRTTTLNTHKKTKARFNRLLRHPAWKRRGLFWFRCFINLSLTYLDTYPLTYSPGTHTGRTIQAVTKDTSFQAYIRLLTAAAPSDSVFRALDTN